MHISYVITAHNTHKHTPYSHTSLSTFSLPATTNTLIPMADPTPNSTTTTTVRPHILVFPYPAQGHMLPLLDLTHHLSSSNVTITILVTPKNLPILQPLLSHNPSIHTLVLPFPPHPSIPAGVENVRDIGNHGNSSIISALSALSRPIAAWFHSHPSPPVAILSDFFLGWTHHLASQLGIPRITFYASGAFVSSVLNHLWLNADKILPLGQSLPFPHLPNSPVFPKDHLPSLFLRYKEAESNPDFQVVKSGSIANFSSYGAVFNTFDDVESAFLEHLRREVGHHRVWAVGPVALLRSKSNSKPDGSNADVFSWLDEFPDGSVIYVSFGSQAFLTPEQMQALAEGLDESGAGFVLAVKSETFVPDGFEERVAGRGLVIKGWAPQAGILGHRAVGGFLTHCGWNSVLEGMVAGVVLFAWPMEADQFINAKLLVEYLGGGVRICEGKSTVPDSAELARCLGEFKSGMAREKMVAMELREKALGAVRENGSSKRDMDGLLEELGTLKHTKR